MPSCSELAQRRIPQQERGARRVAQLLDAAASVIGENGYDAATMSDIAVRANASIGSLYQFFPNKECLTDALRDQYCEELREIWTSFEKTPPFAVADLVRRLINEIIAFLDERPAFVNLLVLPCRPKNTALRDLLRERLFRILHRTAPHLPETRIRFIAATVLQVMKAMNELYAEFEAGKRRALIREYERLLSNYLEMQLNGVSKG